MRALHAAWTSEHGKDSVVGLAPSRRRRRRCWPRTSASTARTPPSGSTSTTTGEPQFRKGQLVIIDEATLAGTLTLDRLTGLAADAGAKVLLVGDWAQLQSVDAGGAFALLAAARDDTPELTEVHRFTHEWEKHASLDLRNGRTEVIGTYVRHDRVQDGTHRGDGRRRVPRLARRPASRSQQRARHRSRPTRSSSSTSAPAPSASSTARPMPSREVELADGTRASVGDLVITRQQRPPPPRAARRLGPQRRPVASHRRPRRRIGRRPTARHDGSAAPSCSRRRTSPSTSTSATPITAHRAQGITVDTAHVVVTGSTTRENFYVSMTRGRESNIAYVALDRPDDSHAAPSPEEVTARTVLYGVLQHSGVELSAHQTIEAEQEHWSSIAQLAAEYETIAAAAQHDRWVAELSSRRAHDEQVDAVVASDSFGPLAAELRRAEANDHDIAAVLPRVVAQRVARRCRGHRRRAHQSTAARDVRVEAGRRRGRPTHRRPRSRSPTGRCPTRCAERSPSARS